MQRKDEFAMFSIIKSDRAMSLEEVAAELGISKSRVARIEHCALRKMYRAWLRMGWDRP